MKSRTAVAALLTVALFGSACSRTPKDPVRDCLRRVVAAAEARDTDGVMALVSDTFRDGEGGGKSDTAGLVKRTLAAYESLSLTLSDVAIERGASAAQVKLKVRMSGRPRAVAGLEGLLPRSSRWSFDFRLEAEKGGWRIVSASWSRLEDE